MALPQPSGYVRRSIGAVRSTSPLSALRSLLLIAVSLTAACHDSRTRTATNQPSRLDGIRARGELRIGTTGDYRPYSYRASENDAFQGIDIDLGRDLATSLGVRVRFVMTSWPTLLDDLEHDRFDVAMSGISRTAPREARAAFSDGYSRTGKTPIARCEDRPRFDSLEKIDQPGVRVLVNPGGTNERFARSHVHRADITVIPDNRTIFARIVANEGDVMFTDSDEVRLQTHLLPVLCAAMPSQEFEATDKAVLMPKDVPLKEAVDKWLHTTKDSGALRSTFEKHLGS